MFQEQSALINKELFQLILKCGGSSQTLGNNPLYIFLLFQPQAFHHIGVQMRPVFQCPDNTAMVISDLFYDFSVMVSIMLV